MVFSFLSYTNCFLDGQYKQPDSVAIEDLGGCGLLLVLIKCWNKTIGLSTVGCGNSVPRRSEIFLWADKGRDL